jgi:hypothetical protein
MVATDVMATPSSKRNEVYFEPDRLAGVSNGRSAGATVDPAKLEEMLYLPMEVTAVDDAQQLVIVRDEQGTVGGTRALHPPLFWPVPS